MYFKVLILKNFVSIIIILDTFIWYFILQMIIRVLKSKGEEKYSKRMKNEKGGLDAQTLRIECHGIGRIQQIGSSFNAAALSTECHEIRNGRKLAEQPMPRHSGIKGDNVAAEQTASTSLHCGGQNMILKVESEEVVFYKVVEDSKTFNLISELVQK